MCSAVKLQTSSYGIGPASTSELYGQIVSARGLLIFGQLRLPRRRFSSLSMKLGCISAAVEEGPQTSVSSSYTSSVGPPPPALQLSQWNLTQRHILMLNVVACAVAVSATWLFFSAIPALLAFKTAAESLEKLMDAAREELPDTMAAVRLSGMEISDLTRELSDLGQEITQGVRSSTRAVRSAEESLRRINNTTTPASVQGMMVNQKTRLKGPVVAVRARGIRERIVKGRSLFRMFLSLAQFSRLALNYLASQRRK